MGPPFATTLPRSARLRGRAAAAGAVCPGTAELSGGAFHGLKPYGFAIPMVNCYISYNWLVVTGTFYIFSYIHNNHPN